MINGLRVAALAFAIVSAIGHVKAADPRIRTVSYSENAVYALKGHLGFQTAIELNEDETIENVAIGDSATWQVTPNRRGDVVILKPIDLAPPTNLTVVTSLRRYIFALEVEDAADADAGEMTFVLKFRYPDRDASLSEPEPAPELAPEFEVTPLIPAEADVNRAYSYSGSSEIIPAKIFDDGVSTYFQFPSRTPTPAIFLINADDEESVINHGYRGDFIVVDRIARRFLLRYGGAETVIYNDGFTPVDPGPEAPRRRPEERGFFSRLFGDGDEG